jgi:hypothetical protein
MPLLLLQAGAVAWRERGAAGGRNVAGSNPANSLPGVVVRAVCTILVDGGWVWLLASAVCGIDHTIG